MDTANRWCRGVWYHPGGEIRVVRTCPCWVSVSQTVAGGYHASTGGSGQTEGTCPGDELAPREQQACGCAGRGGLSHMQEPFVSGGEREKGFGSSVGKVLGHEEFMVTGVG